MTRAAVLGGETIDVVVSHSRRHLNGVQIRDVADFIGSTAPPPPGPHIPPGAYFLDCCLESVRRDHTGLQSFLNISLRKAERRNPSPLRLTFSQSLASRLPRPSHANVRSTTHRFGKTTKPLARSERLTISTFTCVIIFVTARRNTGP